MQPLSLWNRSCFCSRFVFFRPTLSGNNRADKWLRVNGRHVPGDDDCWPCSGRMPLRSQSVVRAESRCRSRDACRVVDRLIQVPLQSDGLASKGFPFHLCLLRDRWADKHYCLVNRLRRATLVTSQRTSWACRWRVLPSWHRRDVILSPPANTLYDKHTAHRTRRDVVARNIWSQLWRRARDTGDKNETSLQKTTTRELAVAADTWRHDDRLSVAEVELEMVAHRSALVLSRQRHIRYICPRVYISVCSFVSLLLGTITLYNCAKTDAISEIFRRICPEIRNNRLNTGGDLGFYSASALLAVQNAVIARGIPSVRLSVRHVSVLCPEKWRYDRVW